MGVSFFAEAVSSNEHIKMMRMRKLPWFLRSMGVSFFAEAVSSYEHGYDNQVILMEVWQQYVCCHDAEVCHDTLFIHAFTQGFAHSPSSSCRTEYDLMYLHMCLEFLLNYCFFNTSVHLLCSLSSKALLTSIPMGWCVM